MRFVSLIFLTPLVIQLLTSCESRQTAHQRIVEDSVNAVFVRAMSEQPGVTLEGPGTFTNFRETELGYTIDGTFRMNGYNPKEHRNVRGETTVRINISREFIVDMKAGKVLYQKRLN